MCLIGMSVTPPGQFQHYQDRRALRARINQCVQRMSAEDHAEIDTVLEACVVATDGELDVLQMFLWLEELDFAAVIEWARTVLWGREMRP